MDDQTIMQRKALGRPGLSGKIPEKIFSRLLENIAQVPKDFIGREEEIARIRHFIGNRNDAVKVVVLYGPPLVGK